MADNTKIEWADATLNYANGCSVVSPGCKNCYAMRLAGTRMKGHPTRAGLTVDSKTGPVWNGEVRLHEPALLQALAWKRPRKIFWNAHGDIFHEAVPDEAIDRMLAVCALTPHHTHMILTKRSARMVRYMTAIVSGARSIWEQARSFGAGGATIARLISELGWGRFSSAPHKPLPNVQMGVSVEDQPRADERIPDLLKTPAVFRFISAEPLLGGVDLGRWLLGWHPTDMAEVYRDDEALGGLDLVIAGGESGPRARPMHPGWPRQLRDQCAAAGVAFDFKQWGEWVPIVNGRTPDGALFGGLFEWIDSEGLIISSLNPPPGSASIARVGKRGAGRILDGVEHNGSWGANHG